MSTIQIVPAPDCMAFQPTCVGSRVVNPFDFWVFIATSLTANQQQLTREGVLKIGLPLELLSTVSIGMDQIQQPNTLVAVCSKNGFTTCICRRFARPPKSAFCTVATIEAYIAFKLPCWEQVNRNATHVLYELDAHPIEQKPDPVDKSWFPVFG